MLETQMKALNKGERVVRPDGREGTVERSTWLGDGLVILWDGEVTGDVVLFIAAERLERL